MKKLEKDNVNKCGTKDSPVNVTLKVIGGKWKPVILWFLRTNKIIRFNELNRQIEGITQKMLTQQLRELESAGLILRKVYPEVPPKVEYSLTEKGHSLEPVLKAMAMWGERYS
jgi:DNA-binding HxlR family transcriptional regulator